MNEKIRIDHLSKRFKVYNHPTDRLREWLGGGKRHDEHWALRDISFSVKQGEVFGIVGPNGSGKSTLLKIITGVLFPTSGSTSADGFVVSLLELGTGFNADLSGRDNIINSSRLLGLSSEFVNSKLQAIIDFAEVGSYINHPIKFYSSGMLVRLAFSVFANIDPDVLIVDEALSVGDIYFQQKCFRRIEELRNRGCTMLFVSHDLDAVRRLCGRAMYLDAGCSRAIGPAVDVVDLYIAAMTPGARAVDLKPAGTRSADDGGNGHSPDAAPGKLSRIGSGGITIEQVEVQDGNGCAFQTFVSGETARVVVRASVREPQHGVSFGLLIYDRFGTVVFGTSSDMVNPGLHAFAAGQRIEFTFEIRLALQIGAYSVDADIGAHDQHNRPIPLDRVSSCATFEISRLGQRRFHGITPLECTGRLQVLDPACC